MFWPKKRKQLQEEEASTPNILTILPRDLVIYMMQFLTVYERVGLGEVSKPFRELLTRYFGYDPFASSPELWTSLGEVSRAGRLAARDVEALQRMAGEAYMYIYRNLQSIGRVGQGVCCSTLVKLSTENVTPTGHPFIRANCLAELQVGGKTVRAVNFTNYADRDAAVRLMESLGVDMDAVNYQLVTRRHAEMRLILKLIEHPDGSADLRIDKLCCVFCAAQLMALGYKHLIAGWAAGSLQWYTFSPVTMFFTNRRAAIWGGTIEREFAVLSQDHKLEFLHLLARQASRSSAPSPVVPPTPSPGMLQIASNPVFGGGSGPPPQPVPLAPPACPECGGQMALRTNRRSGQRFWGCRRFPDCKGTMSM